MTGNKVFGVILLVLGLLIILWGLYSSYNIFKGNAVLPQVFRSDEAMLGESLEETSEAQSFSPEAIQENMEDMIEGQLAKIFPAGTLLRLLNLVAWSIFAWILIMGGGKIAFLGIKMLK